MIIPDTRLAMTLFNVREYCKTEDDLRASLAKIRRIGFRAVQISAVPAIPPATIKRCLDEAGIYCCATHESLADLTENAAATIEKLKLYECDFTALGSPGDGYLSAEGLERLAAALNEAGAQFRKRGIRLGFHNHHAELERFGDEVYLEGLYRRTAPANLWAELDLHWIARGGGSPVAWLEIMASRLHAIHLKDFALRGREPVFAEIGEGNLDWDRIVAVCNLVKVRWLIVEQDVPTPGRDIFDSMRISFENMRRMGWR